MTSIARILCFDQFKCRSDCKALNQPVIFRAPIGCLLICILFAGRWCVYGHQWGTCSFLTFFLFFRACFSLHFKEKYLSFNTKIIRKKSTDLLILQKRQYLGPEKCFLVVKNQTENTCLFVCSFTNQLELRLRGVGQLLLSDSGLHTVKTGSAYGQALGKREQNMCLYVCVLHPLPGIQPPFLMSVFLPSSRLHIPPVVLYIT